MSSTADHDAYTVDRFRILTAYCRGTERNIFRSEIEIPQDVITLLAEFYGFYNYQLYPYTNYPSSSLSFAFQHAIIHNPYRLYRGHRKILYQNWQNEIFVCGSSWNKWNTHSSLQSITSLNDLRNRHNEVITSTSDFISVISEGLDCSFTLFISNSGKAYAIGYVVNLVHLSLKSILVNIEETLHRECIKKITCGKEHILILTEKGSVFAMGNNQDGQCGVNSNTHCVTPTKIALEDTIKIQDIGCGSHHNLLLSVGHKLWVFGKNQSGEIGLGKGSQHKQSTPILNPLLSQIRFRKIDCGSRHSLAITENDRCYLMGRNGHGQCGKGVSKSSVHRVKTPFLFQSLNNVLIEDGSLGHLHTILLTTDNECLGFGNNKYQQIGLVHRTPLYDPYRLTKTEIGIAANQRILRVLAMKYSSLIITAST